MRDLAVTVSHCKSNRALRARIACPVSSHVAARAVTGVRVRPVNSKRFTTEDRAVDCILDDLIATTTTADKRDVIVDEVDDIRVQTYTSS